MSALFDIVMYRRTKPLALSEHGTGENYHAKREPWIDALSKKKTSLNITSSLLQCVILLQSSPISTAY
eukprot:4730908-Pyramimonas_sp.AAC.1